MIKDGMSLYMGDRKEGKLIMAEEMNIVLRNRGRIDPLKIEDYLAVGGYKSLEKAREMGQLAVIEEIKKSGLRGRGGAGFSTGLKMSFSQSIQTAEKYVICNADEGEPGTYKDRIILESDPQKVIEGIAISAFAIGARKGYIYCRGEYSHLADLLNQAISQANTKGLLEDFELEVRLGAGAYVVGEESAMIESIEGRRGEPRFKPPFPPVAGLNWAPTIVNNVETFANLAEILHHGASWFAGIGAPGYPGTKVLSLTGDVANRVCIEVPTDLTVREVIDGFGGGIAGGKVFKAAQIGGTSGAFIPEALLDTAIDFDSLAAAGASLGSGAIFVLDESRDMVDVATQIAKFFEHESCGKCNPCREGTFRVHQMMGKINQGLATAADIKKIRRLAQAMQQASLCGCGQTAPMPILSAMAHFYPEFTGKLIVS